MNKRLWAKASVFALAAGICAPQMAAAQGAVDVLRDEILVTGTKKANAENVQDVPLAVTAYGDEQLDALKVRDLGNLSYSVPNVGLEDVGTSRGVANFSIRGLGVNSSIPSIDPAVGVFVDGIYLGGNAGVVLDIFDLASVEVLRGPQGILFGRNVTGGAVLINTKRPNLSEFEASGKFAAESGFRGTGMNYYAMGSVSGPLVEDRLALKLAAYYNEDGGWQKRYLGGPNLINRINALGPAGAGAPWFLQNGVMHPAANPTGGTFPVAQVQPDAFEDHGEAQTWLIRPSLLWAMSDNVELLLRYEHGDSDGDGPSAQNHTGFRQLPFDPIAGAPPAPIPSTNVFFSADKDSFTFSIDEPGFYDAKWDSASAELNIDVGDNGRITNIFGWRQYDSQTLGDIDGTPLWLFHATSDGSQEQISNEIRYADRLGDFADLTMGFYYYSDDKVYQENRQLLGGSRRFHGGGTQDSRSYGVFGQLDLDITDRFVFIAGGRYTNERKEATLYNLTFNAAPCSVAEGTCLTVPVGHPLYGSAFWEDSNTWTKFTPKLGFRWAATDELNVYGHWTQGVRSGGYNFRNTSVVFPIERFEDENVDSYEVGFKAQPSGRATINAAIFYSDISDMQRELNLADAVAGVVQIIRNTADAHIFGFEVETQVFLTDNLVFMGNIGHLDGEYDVVAFDINSDGVTNAFDEHLMIPRLAPWTYGAGFVHSWDWGNLGTMSTRFQWSHRDDNAYTDNNLGILQGADIIDLSFALRTFNDQATISLYGQNLTNEVTHGGETQLPTSLGGGSFAPLNKGRIVGVELQVDI